MKKVIFAAFAFFAGCILAGQPEDWYLPNGWKSNSGATAKVEYEGTDGDKHYADAYVDPYTGEFKINADDVVDTPEFNANKTVLLKVFRNQIEIEKIGENLESYLGEQRTYKVEQKNSDGTITKLYVTIPGAEVKNGIIKPKVGADGTVQSEGESIPISEPDDLSIGRDPSKSTSIQIKGWTTLDNQGGTLADELGAGDSRTGRELYGVVVRTAKGGPVTYMPIGRLASGKIDDITIGTNEYNRLELKGWSRDGGAADRSESEWLIPYARFKRYGLQWGSFANFLGTNAFEFAVDEGCVYPFGWMNEVDADKRTLSEILLAEEGEDSGGDAEKMYLMVRSGTGDNLRLDYIPIGTGLDGVAWATNWTEAVDHITKEETIEIVSFVTNTYTHANFVTNFITSFEIVENWTYVTNYIVRYLGVTGSGGGQGGQGDAPAIAPKDDPYSGEYEPHVTDDFYLPVKNALNIVAITNEPLSEIESENLLDFVSVDTNKENLVQIRGFDEADEESIPVKRRGVDEGEYKLDWMASPTTLLEITTNGIAEIKSWMIKNAVSNIFTTVVTNSEALTTMRTNFFGFVEAERMLDDDSVWTNGSRRVEIKGYETAPLYSVPFVDLNSEIVAAGKEKGLLWARMPFADSDANEHTGNSSIPRTIEANLERSVTDGQDEIKSLSLYGFSFATDGQVPMKSGSVEPGGAESLVWVDPMRGDNVSITTNADDGATANGVLSIYGYETAAAGTVLRRTPDGVEWSGLADEVSITTNRDTGAVTPGKLSIYGFKDAPNDSILRKDENGDLVWGGASAITNTILAGAGINITDNGGGAITISAQSMEDPSGGGAGVCVVTVVTDARYDETSHKFQVKTRMLTFTGSMTDETEWQDVFEAVSHKSEHEGGSEGGTVE